MINLGMRIRKQSRRDIDDEPMGHSLNERLNRYVEFVGYQRVERPARRPSAWETIFQSGSR